MFDPALLKGLLAAVGIGLLVGIERERSKGEGQGRAAAGIRTFALVALAGAVAEMLGGVGLAIAGGFVALAALASYRHTRSRDPGLTTEIALLLVFLLGVLAMRDAAFAAGVGVGVALLLAAKSRLHRFVRHTLSEQELHDALLLAAGAAIVLPLLPDHAIDPWQVLNLRKLWLLALIVMAINAAGHVALRALGAGRGLMLAGFAGGFVSSAATIAAMGSRTRGKPDLLPACVSAALVSNVSTVIELAVIAGALSGQLLRAIALPLAVSGLVVAGFALLSAWRSRRQPLPEVARIAGRPFEPRQILVFVAVVALVLLASAAMLAWLGDGALAWTLAASGLADVHAAAASAAQFVALGRVDVDAAVLALLAALAANSLSKLVVAFVAGGRGFGLRVLPGVVAMVATFAGVVLVIRA